jgi:hypothetical protein
MLPQRHEVGFYGLARDLRRVEYRAVGEDRTPSKHRTTVSEAAKTLGISAEAVRGRIRRGTIPVEREGGAVYVLLEGGPQDRTTDDQSRTTANQPNDRTDLLIAELQDRVRSLEEANRENRRIIAVLTSRIPAIESPQDARESPETAWTGEDAGPPRSDAPERQEGAPHRAWWKRVFRG